MKLQYDERVRRYEQVMPLKGTMSRKAAGELVGLPAETVKRYWLGGKPGGAGHKRVEFPACRKGHRLSDENVMLHHGRRHCKVCHRERQRRYTERLLANGGVRGGGGSAKARAIKAEQLDPELAHLPIPVSFNVMWLYGPAVAKAFRESGVAVSKLEALHQAELAKSGAGQSANLNVKGRMYTRLAALDKPGEWMRYDAFDRVFSRYWIKESDIEGGVVESVHKPTNR